MFREWVIALVLLGVASGHAAHPSPKHTDGTEPYYHPEALVQWMETVPEDLRPHLFASEEDVVWWKEARFGLFYCWVLLPC